MSVQPGPRNSGNLSISADCTSCSNGTAPLNSQKGQNYGDNPPAEGSPVGVCTSGGNPPENPPVCTN